MKLVLQQLYLKEDTSKRYFVCKANTKPMFLSPGNYRYLEEEFDGYIRTFNIFSPWRTIEPDLELFGAFSSSPPSYTCPAECAAWVSLSAIPLATSPSPNQRQTRSFIYLSDDSEWANKAFGRPHAIHETNDVQNPTYRTPMEFLNPPYNAEAIAEERRRYEEMGRLGGFDYPPPAVENTSYPTPEPSPPPY